MKMINAVDPYSSLYVPSQRTASKELDKNAFLLLLVTQLKNQNPLEPMENREFISPTHTVSTLEFER
jgi:flagellar basal-body rod modification protein FlgD